MFKSLLSHVCLAAEIRVTFVDLVPTDSQLTQWTGLSGEMVSFLWCGLTAKSALSCHFWLSLLPTAFYIVTIMVWESFCICVAFVG